MHKCPDCGGTHVRCTACGARFDLIEGVALVLEILNQANEPMYGTTLAGLAGYSVPGMYNLLDRLIAQGRVVKVGTGRQRRGYQIVKVLQFPQRTPLEQAA
jgi:DNA-binding MarR family transcriptional regulator